MTPPQSYGLSGSWNDYSTYTEEKWGIEKKFDASRSLKKLRTVKLILAVIWLRI